MSSVIVISHTPSGKNLVRTDENGWLWCIVCIKDWCDHIREAVKNNLDGDALWKELRARSTPFAVVSVPFFAAPNRRVLVRVLKFSAPGYEHAARVIFAKKPQAETDIAWGARIGVLADGEGRVVMARMISAWFQPQYTRTHEDLNLHPPCMGRNHAGLRADLLNEYFRKSVHGREENFWTCLFHKLCVICYEEEKPATHSFDPDLIPTP